MNRKLLEDLLTPYVKNEVERYGLVTVLLTLMELRERKGFKASRKKDISQAFDEPPFPDFFIDFEDYKGSEDYE